MTELVFENLQWCSEHGHPFLTLRTTTQNRYLIVAISTDDAQALAVTPPATSPGARSHALLVNALVHLGARLEFVDLLIAPDRTLRATLHIERNQERFTLPAYFADGLALARRARTPLRMSEQDLARVPTQTVPGTDACATAPPEAFRELIDTLDLSGLGHGDQQTGKELSG